MDEEARALEVREELVAEAGAVGRALDEPGDVGDRELPRVRARRPTPSTGSIVVNG